VTTPLSSVSLKVRSISKQLHGICVQIDQLEVRIKGHIHQLKIAGVVTAAAFAIAALAVGIFLLFNPYTLAGGIALIAVSASIFFLLGEEALRSYYLQRKQEAKNGMLVPSQCKEITATTIKEIDTQRASCFGLPTKAQEEAQVQPYSPKDFKGHDEFQEIELDPSAFEDPKETMIWDRFKDYCKNNRHNMSISKFD